MKRSMLIIITIFTLCLFTQNVYGSEFLYNKESIDLDITISSTLTGNAQNVIVRQNNIPRSSESQRVISQTTSPSAQFINNAFVFEWSSASSPSYSINSKITSTFFSPQIKKKITYPTRFPANLVEYTQPSTHIDSDNVAIKQQAQQLASGEDDLYVVLFKLASWVEENIEYELSTLTTEVSQTSSWVLENRIGVCDEMTSLFIGMSRSLDIPARFVSGLTYTTSTDFNENWLPHGWAEVYLDNQWVPFDPTFGEIGFVDATHIKLSDHIDSKYAARAVLWEGTQIKPEKIKFDIKSAPGQEKASDIQMTTTIASEKVGVGSYNKVTTHLQNLRDYYIATTLYLALPVNLATDQQDQIHVLLTPGEVRDINWIVKVSDNIDKKVSTTFQVDVYNERNERASALFRASESGITYTKESIQESGITEKLATKKMPTETRLSLGQRMLIFLKRLFSSNSK